MLLIIRSCFLIFIAKECLASSMSKGDLKGFDKNVRVELAVMITKELEPLTKQIESVEKSCFVKINDTIDKCSSCPKGGSRKSALNKAVSVLSTPISQGRELVNSIKDSLSKGDVKALMGIRMKTLHPMFVGAKIVNLISPKLGKMIGTLTNSVSRIPSLIGNGVQSLVGSIGDGLSSLKFWRKKRSICAKCGKILSKDPNVLLANVCGTKVAQSLSGLANTLKKLEILYEVATNGNVLKQVITGAPKIVMSPVFSVSAGLRSITYSIGSTTKTLRGGSNERVDFTNKKKSYALLASKIFRDFV